MYWKIAAPISISGILVEISNEAIITLIRFVVKREFKSGLGRHHFAMDALYLIGEVTRR